MLHELKIHPRFFDAVKNGIKTFEVRRNDRPFAVGDTLLLQEFDPAYSYDDDVDTGYTGRECAIAVTYILDDPQYCPEGHVILGIKAV